MLSRDDGLGMVVASAFVSAGEMKHFTHVADTAVFTLAK